MREVYAKDLLLSIKLPYCRTKTKTPKLPDPLTATEKKVFGQKKSADHNRLAAAGAF